MRRLIALSLGALLLAPGCTQLSLRRETVDQASTLSDLQYNIVLKNLAMFASRPSALPWHVNISGGTAQVSNLAGGQVLLGSNSASGVSGTRSVVQQWGLEPVTDPDELRLLRFAYRRALGSPEMPDPDFLDDVAHKVKLQIVGTEDLKSQSSLFYRAASARHRESYENLADGIDSTLGDEEIVRDGRPYPEPEAPEPRSPLAREVIREVDDLVDDLRGVPAGWFHVGRKHDVPKDACYVGHHGDCYVWVGPDGLEALTQFTLTVIDLATVIQPPQLFGSPGGGVSYSPSFETID